jgi:MFS family permease
VLSQNWIFYWYDDLLDCAACEGFTVFGVTVAHSTETAMAGVGVAMNFVATFVSVPGGGLGDRFGRKRVVLVCEALLVPPMLVFALVSVVDTTAVASKFTVVLLVQLYTAVVSGIAGPNLQALNADCLPRGPDGVSPKNASRDVLLISISLMLPAIFLPAPMGHLLDRLNDCGAAAGGSAASGSAGSGSWEERCSANLGYVVFFVAAAGFYALAVLVLLPVRVPVAAAAVEGRAELAASAAGGRAAAAALSPTRTLSDSSASSAELSSPELRRSLAVAEVAADLAAAELATAELAHELAAAELAHELAAAEHIAAVRHSRGAVQ